MKNGRTIKSHEIRSFEQDGNVSTICPECKMRPLICDLTIMTCTCVECETVFTLSVIATVHDRHSERIREYREKELERVWE